MMAGMLRFKQDLSAASSQPKFFLTRFHFHFHLYFGGRSMASENIKKKIEAANEERKADERRRPVLVDIARPGSDPRAQRRMITHAGAHRLARMCGRKGA